MNSSNLGSTTFLVLFFLVAPTLLHAQASTEQQQICRQMISLYEDTVAARNGFLRAAPNAPFSSKNGYNGAVRAAAENVRYYCRKTCRVCERGADIDESIAELEEQLVDRDVKISDENYAIRWKTAAVFAGGVALGTAAVVTTATCLGAAGFTVFTLGLGSPTLGACAFGVVTTIGGTAAYAAAIANLRGSVNRRDRYARERNELQNSLASLKSERGAIEVPRTTCSAMRTYCSL